MARKQNAEQARDALRNKLQGLSATLTKTDRIITGNGAVVVNFQQPQIAAPSATDGRVIMIDPNKIDVGSASGLVNLLGLNYHEVCHILFSPRKSDATMQRIIQDGLHFAWNILEDMRIESLFAAMYGRASKFFTAPVMTYIVGNEDAWDLAHLMTYGRKFLPKTIRDEFKAQFRGTTAQRERAERIIRAYRKVRFHPPGTVGSLAVDGKVLSLVEDFAKLLQDLIGSDPNPLDSHPKCAQNARSEGKVDAQAAETASQRQDEEDAAQDEEENSSGDDGSEGSGDVDPEDEEGESQASGDAGDDFEDESEPDETDDGDSGRGDDGSDDDAEDESGSDAHGGADDASDSDGDAERGDGTPSGSGDSDPEDESGGVEGDGAGSGRSEEQTKEDTKSAIAEALADVMADDDVKNEITTVRAAMDDTDHVDFEGERQGGSASPVEPGMVSASGRVEQELRRLREQFESGWNRGTDHGIVNFARAIESDYDHESMYDLWEEGNEEDSGLEVVILLDMSISMNTELKDAKGQYLTPTQTRMQAACSALWILKRGLDMNEATTSVIGFGSNMVKIFGRDDKVQPHEYETHRATHGGTQVRNELKEARRILQASDKPNRLLVLITDGVIQDYYGGDDTTIRALSEVPATRMLVQIGSTENTNEEFAALCDVSCNVSTTGQLVDLVRDTVTSLLLRKVRS